MFVDELKISVKAGRGGDGSRSLCRTRYAPRGGPDGGNGGSGGNVIFVADANLNTLQHFRGVKLFKAERGVDGASQLKAGKSGEDEILKVPVGTLVRCDGKILADLDRDGASYLAARGGLGGKGNANFTSSTRQCPRFAELGEPGEERELELELQLLADVGIIGLPSVGKSTLISAISAARPKIAAYHFTTLTPNLGVISHKKNNFVASDMPGLIRGASRGKGLGHQFLRHASRVKFFWHLVSADSATPVGDLREIRDELRKFDSKLAEIPEIVVISRADLVDEKQLASVLAKFKKAGVTPLVISSATREGVEKLLDRTIEGLAKIQPPEKDEGKMPVFRPHLEEKSKSFRARRQNKDLYFVDGPRLNQIAVMTDFSNNEALARLQDVLVKFGVTREIKKLGAEPGAKIEIAGKRFEWWG